MRMKKPLAHVQQLVKSAIPIRIKHTLKHLIPPKTISGASEEFAMNDLINKGDIVFDVGANLGKFTITMCRLARKTGRVYAFEADNKSLEQLKRKIKAGCIKNCVLVHGAVAEKGGETATLYLDERPGWHGVASTIVSELATPNRLGTNDIGKIHVSTISLDDYCEVMKLEPDFMKLDIEGAELLALRGFKKCLERFQPHIVLEYASEGKGLSDTSLHFLQDKGYEIIDLSTYKTVTAQEYSHERVFRNMLAIHREKRKLTPYGRILFKDICVKNAKALGFTDNVGETLRPLMISLDRGRYVVSFIFNARENPRLECAVIADDNPLSSTGGYYDDLNWAPYLVFEVKRRIRAYFSLKRLSKKGTLNFDRLNLQKVVLHEGKASL